METPQPDKTGMHILLKLASLVVILAGIHAAADIIVQLLLALFFAIVLNPLVTWFIRRGVQRPVAITIVVVVMLIALTALVGVLAASFNEFISMLPKFNRKAVLPGRRYRDQKYYFPESVVEYHARDNHALRRYFSAHYRFQSKYDRNRRPGRAL